MSAVCDLSLEDFFNLTNSFLNSVEIFDFGRLTRRDQSLVSVTSENWRKPKFERLDTAHSNPQDSDYISQLNYPRVQSKIIIEELKKVFHLLSLFFISAQFFKIQKTLPQNQDFNMALTFWKTGLGKMMQDCAKKEQNGTDWMIELCR